MKQRAFKGQITVFLSLIFLLILSFIGSMVQSASIYINKSMKRTDTKLALESVFAEYERKMLEEYDIFVISDMDEQRLSERLQFYGAKNVEHDIQKVRFLSDAKGQAFFEQAVQSMGGDPFQVKMVEETEWETKEQVIHDKLENLLAEEEHTLPNENNPLETIKGIKKADFLSVILQDTEKVSDCRVDTNKLPSHRTLREGTSDYLTSSKQGLAETYLFTEYLANHFENYTNHASDNALLYEMEYILAGHETDRENLEVTFCKIFTVRMGVNCTYLLTDYEKQSEAETLAYSLCTALAAPEAAEIVKQALLFAWAYGESVQDLRVLAQGNRVATIKTKDTWQLSLKDVLMLGVTEESTIQQSEKNGMNYGDYIKVFLYMEQKETLAMRALDLIELKTGLRVDNCVTDIQIESTSEMRRNIRDTFITEYHYQ